MFTKRFSVHPTLLILLAALLSSVRARLVVAEIPGEYAFEIGPTQCAPSVHLSIASENESVRPQTINLAGAMCTSGSLSFTRDMPSGDNFTRALNNDTLRARAGSLIVGVVEKRIVCAQNDIARGTKLNFLRPLSTFTFQFDGMRNAGGGNGSGRGYEFERNEIYLVLGEKCVYHKLIPAEPKKVKVTLYSRWSWLGPLLGVVIAFFGAALVLFISHVLHNRRVKTTSMDNQADIHSFASTALPPQQYHAAYAGAPYGLYYNHLQHQHQPQQAAMLPRPPPPVR